MLKYLMLTILAVPAAGAEIRKCSDPNGRISYKDTPCVPPEKSLEINRDYANNLHLAPSDEAQALVSDIARERKKRVHRRVRERNKAMRELSRKHREKRARCEQYKEEYDALLRFKRRNGNRAGDYESKLIRMKREACSS